MAHSIQGINAQLKMQSATTVGRKVTLPKYVYP